MNRVRRAFVMASVEQYLSLVVNFILVATLSRLLTPSEIGIAVIGLGVCVITFSLREFVTAEFLVQRPVVLAAEVQTSGTVLLCACTVLGACLLLAAPLLSRFYGEEGLQLFLTVMIMATLIETVSYPAIALLHRDLDFGNTARIRVAAILAMAVTTIGLAAMGVGFMSYAWGNLVAACATTLMTTFIHRTPCPEGRHSRPGRSSSTSGGSAARRAWSTRSTKPYRSSCSAASCRCPMSDFTAA